METMLVTKQNSELKSIFDKIQNLCMSSQLKGYRIGLAGSYSRGDENEKSDIDIIVDTDMLSLEQIEFIHSQFDKEVDVVQLKLLQSEDKRLDGLAVSQGLLINDESTYKSICKEVVWYK